jgi:adenosylcobyric acid synthase
MSSQVVVRGKIWGKLSASDYHQRRVEELLPVVRESYQILAAQHDLILLEGAGSPAEINLKQHDIVNMRMAEMADAHCLLVGDIDRGGVFASLFGTVQLLDPPEQARIHGFLINKFRGDVTLVQPGLRMIEARLHKPCLGVIPHIPNLALDEEDSLGLDTSRTQPWSTDASPDRPLRIAVLALPSFSNFTDFDALQHEPSVALRFCKHASELPLADILILPGSKQTVEDLLWMRGQHLDAAILAHAAHSLVVGICGGMQMLGAAILDPHFMEHGGRAEALNLLPFTTYMNAAKTTRQAAGSLATSTLFHQPVPAIPLNGYEIHIGETTYAANALPFSFLHDAQPDGCISPDTRIFGTYLHGLFDDDTFRHTFIAAARAFHQLAPATHFENWKQKREASLNQLASTVRASLDMPRIFSWAGLDYDPHP